MAEKQKTGAASYNSGNQIEIQLGQDRSLQLRSRLLQGEQVKDLVPVLQGEWGVFADKKASTVATMLYRYSREVVKREAVQRVVATVETHGHVAVTTLEDLAELCRKQKKRVDKALEIEGKINGILTDQATNQIRVFGALLKDLAALQIETGLMPRAPKTVQGMLISADGTPTAFGWVESDDDLLARLKNATGPVYEPDPA